MSKELIALTEDEQLVLAALIHLLVRQDGILTTAEQAAIEWVSEVVADAEPKGDEAGSPYREDDAAAEAIGTQRMRELLDEAAQTMSEDHQVRSAIQKVTREQARNDIYGLLFEVAASDTVQASEWPVLDWLAEAWSIDRG
jgi:hypothetical protein